MGEKKEENAETALSSTHTGREKAEEVDRGKEGEEAEGGVSFMIKR